MYGFGKELTVENIFKKISSYDIFKYYSENFREVGRIFNSDFRKDNNPSCCIAQIKGDLLYTDFGTGKSYRCLAFVMEKLGLNYFQALQQVNLDFNLGLGCLNNSKINLNNPNIVMTSKKHFTEKSNTILQIKRRAWENHDKEFWYDRYFITQEVLEKFKVSPISYFWINGNMIKADKFAYNYDFYWKEDFSVFYRKIYQPYSKKMKWLSNGGKTYQGEGVLPKKGDTLIITKSLKDVMVLYSLGYTAIAPPSESLFLDENYLIKQKKRFKKLILFYDNDITGINKAKKFSEEYKIPYIYIPEEFEKKGIKDISDLIESNGIIDAKLFIEKVNTI